MSDKTKDHKTQLRSGSPDSSLPKEKMPADKAVKQTLGEQRRHLESLGSAWAAVSGIVPHVLIPQVVATVLKEGGTRPAWQWQAAGKDYVLLAWPKEQPLRASVLLSGDKDGELRPVSAVPLLEGLPNDLTVSSVHPWDEGGGANVGVAMLEEGQPMWFYDPLYTRDRNDLTEDVTHTFLLAALAFGVRKALLDEITITQGPNYEAYAEAWLAANPGKSRLDVPPFKVPVAGKHIIHPGQAFAEYQIRAQIQDIDTCQLEKMPMKILYTRFPFENRPQLNLPIYVAELNLKGYEPKVGDEIDAYVWFQGRVIDIDDTKSQEGGA